ncbi:hypothetical protein PHJA_002476600 [Phtheirospermum japonicum]|uniref:Mitochondrial transcription termination factor n=1 Tax=Phtheirospermum japonicum TaxID=374723 RepID=A0A830CRY2_9LAMI|nr:hypothetical protein PHJA_002476600 [Phtheirospermum japonicum]
MFAILCRRRLGIRVPPIYCNFVGQQFRAPENAVLVRSCSSTVCENASEKSFTVSYLINSCGLSSNDAVSASKKLCCIKSPENPDAVLKLLREYGFTDAHIHRIINGWPKVLLACPNKTLLPKLEFLRSIAVPLPVLTQKLSLYPFILARSLEKSLVPLYNGLKSLLGSDERVVHVFMRSPCTFGRFWSQGFYSNISSLRERGVPESTIVTLVMRQPSLLVLAKEKLAAHVDRAVAMGFDVSKGAFVHAIQVFASLTESTLKRKMEVYRRCGWSESETIAAFLKHPMCMILSEEKITATMDFFVDKSGCEPAAIAQCPVLLNLSLEKRIKPRCLVSRILNDKGLKNMNSVVTFLLLSEELFLKRYIVKYEKDIPELLDIYLGKVEMDFSGEVISK